MFFRTALFGILAGIGAATAAAQSEAALKKAFEGKRVLVKIEMPATKWGIDVVIGSATPIDFRTYSHRIKQYGTALRPGDSALVTGVKVKDNLIEFQLAGGGYGTLFDETDAHVYSPSSPKTRREKDLEKALEGEKNPSVRRKIKDELGELRAERARHDRLTEALAAQASELKRDYIREKALGSGSRFNLRYPKDYLKGSVPTPEEVMETLGPYVVPE